MCGSADLLSYVSTEQNSISFFPWLSLLSVLSSLPLLRDVRWSVYIETLMPNPRVRSPSAIHQPRIFTPSVILLFKKIKTRRRVQTADKIWCGKLPRAVQVILNHNVLTVP